MRIVLSIFVFLCGTLGAIAQNPQDIQQRSRGISEQPIAPEGLKVSRYASGLGQITAIVGHSNGSIYISDQKRGRVYHLSDRNKDGVPDQTRMIADGFSSPSGLAVVGSKLYVSDAYAIWEVPLVGGEKYAFVSLSNAKGVVSPRPLLAMKSLKPGLPDASRSLVMGLTKSDGTGQLISIDIYSRQAKLLAQSPQPINSIAQSGMSVWIGTDRGIIPVNGDQVDVASAYEIGAPVTGLVLPGQFGDTHQALTPWKDHILAGLGHTKREGTMTKGSYVATIATQFGNTAGGPESFISGFVSKGGRTGWGQPGPMWMDARGLFLTDSWSGTIWRISGAEVEPSPPEPEVVEDTQVEPEDTEPKSTALPLVEGIEQTPASMLKTGSQIDKASRLEVGSTIVKKYEDDLKAKEDAKKKKDDSKD